MQCPYECYLPPLPRVFSSSLTPTLSTSSMQLTIDVQNVAGIVSLLNDYRMSTGKNPLGFLNPRLYGRGLAGLNDILHGSNLGCSINGVGFAAVAGWDPIRPSNHFLSFRLIDFWVLYIYW